MIKTFNLKDMTNWDKKSFTLLSRWNIKEILNLTTVDLRLSFNCLIGPFYFLLAFSGSASLVNKTKKMKKKEPFLRWSVVVRQFSAVKTWKRTERVHC